MAPVSFVFQKLAVEFAAWLPSVWIRRSLTVRASIQTRSTSERRGMIMCCGNRESKPDLQLNNAHCRWSFP